MKLRVVICILTAYMIVSTCICSYLTNFYLLPFCQLTLLWVLKIGLFGSINFIYFSIIFLSAIILSIYGVLKKKILYVIPGIVIYLIDFAVLIFVLVNDMQKNLCSIFMSLFMDVLLIFLIILSFRFPKEETKSYLTKYNKLLFSGNRLIAAALLIYSIISLVLSKKITHDSWLALTKTIPFDDSYFFPFSNMLMHFVYVLEDDDPLLFSSALSKYLIVLIVLGNVIMLFFKKRWLIYPCISIYAFDVLFSINLMIYVQINELKVILSIVMDFLVIFSLLLTDKYCLNHREV